MDKENFMVAVLIGQEKYMVNEKMGTEVTKEDKYFAPTHKDVKAEIWKSIANGYTFDIHGFDFYDLVDCLDYDWWNNEGGGGTIVLDIRK